MTPIFLGFLMPPFLMVPILRRLQTHRAAGEVTRLSWLLYVAAFACCPGVMIAEMLLRHHYWERLLAAGALFALGHLLAVAAQRAGGHAGPHNAT